jgi:hypothetical protein
VDVEEELIASKLQLKKNGGGYRHYIKDGHDDHDICYGAYMEVKLIDNHLGEWIKGRYVAYLREPVEAYLISGYAQVPIPLGTMVRVRKIFVG